MNKRLYAIPLAAVLGLALLLGSLAALPQPAPAELAPLGARVTTINTASIAADTNFSNNVWTYPNTYADLFYRIDQTSVNTLSLELEVSPDAVNWYDATISATLLSGNAADANGYIYNIPIAGYQYRIVANVTNTNTVTPVLKIVLR
jgi:hypothetical protein